MGERRCEGTSSGLGAGPRTRKHHSGAASGASPEDACVLFHLCRCRKRWAVKLCRFQCSYECDDAVLSSQGQAVCLSKASHEMLAAAAHSAHSFGALNCQTAFRASLRARQCPVPDHCSTHNTEKHKEVVYCFEYVLRMQGMVGNAVGWGPWGGAGMAAADPNLTSRLLRQGKGSIGSAPAAYSGAVVSRTA